MNEKKWYAVYTRVRWEKKVSESLSKKRIENYCPVNKVKRQWADRKKIVEEPLFTSYVFVHANDTDQSSILNTDGIINFVYWLGKPAVIRNNEIEVIQQLLKAHENITVEQTTVNVNDLVRVISGPLMHHEGQVLAVKSKTVKIVLPSLGYVVSAEINMDKIEVIRQKLDYSIDDRRSLARV